MPTSRMVLESMLVSIVTASKRGRSIPSGTPALMSCTAAFNIALPPKACTFTSCTPFIAAADKTAPATVFGMSWNFKSRKMPGPSAAISLTPAGPAAVNSWLPILNKPTRSATCFANFTADDSESKSSATIRLLRGWASKVTVFATPATPGSVFARYVQQFQANLVHAGVNQPDLSGYAVGYINFASFLIGTAVIDTYQFKLAVPGVHDPYYGTERQVRMRRGQCLAIESLAVCRLLAIKTRPVPAGLAYPSLYRLCWLATMRNQRCLHGGRDKEHQWHPADCSPNHEEWFFNSVVFLLQTS